MLLSGKLSKGCRLVSKLSVSKANIKLVVAGREPNNNGAICVDPAIGRHITRALTVSVTEFQKCGCTVHGSLMPIALSIYFMYLAQVDSTTEPNLVSKEDLRI